MVRRRSGAELRLVFEAVDMFEMLEQRESGTSALAVAGIECTGARSAECGALEMWTCGPWDAESVRADAGGYETRYPSPG